MNPSARNIIKELTIVTVVLLILSRILLAFRNVPWLTEYTSSIVAILFLYVPIVVMWRRGRRINFIDRTWPALKRSLLAFAVAAVVIFPIFFLLAHVWEIFILGKHHLGWAGYTDILHMILFQLIIVALPEEFYFRGYFQTALDQVFTKKIRFLGVDIGWGFFITALVFAIAHSIISYQWWHFSIFFPALVFGYLRLRTGSIIAPILFHASANILMSWFARMYV